MTTPNQPDWNSLVSEFGRSIGLSEMSLGDTGLCRVELDDRTAIDFETDGVGACTSTAFYREFPRLRAPRSTPPCSKPTTPVIARPCRSASPSTQPMARNFSISLVPAESADSLASFSTLVSDFSALAHGWCHKSRDLRNATDAPAPIPTSTHASYA
jgi:hypothetical protein